MRVLGVDPGSRRLGIAVVEGDVARPRPIAYEAVSLGRGDLVDRLLKIDQTVAVWLDRYQPEAAAVEDVFVRDNVRSALVLGQARGVVMVGIARAGLRPGSYPPATIKQAIAGHGRAGKAEVRRMVRLQLALDHDPVEDAADALAVAMTHIVHRDFDAQVERVW